ncbi:MAG: oligopeptide transport system ATP-binding protein [Kribbellaceae bacterium]|jgi:oligopeptide transport system ATP-binding protein|nr:oligopeptide transport system ATP-binding protein [Kribbellaceae bacterium]
MTEQVADLVSGQPRSPSEPLLEVSDLAVEFRTARGWGVAVDGISLELRPGRTLAVLGESGSGKSATARAIMGVLPAGAGRISRGRVALHGRDLLKLTAEERRAVRGSQVAMVFQDALSALNPVLPVGYQIGEGCRVHLGMSRRAARERALELLALVGIPDARRRIGDFPHQFSGGMRQRVMIAAALAADPEILIADEPTTALDVTVQAQILQLLAKLQADRQMSLMLITHDMGVVAGMADDILVMYAGRAVEQGPADDVFDRPGHPYTRALLDSICTADQLGKPLRVIGGQPPDLGNLPSGCAFRTRCPLATELCTTQPPVVEISPGHRSACHFAVPAPGGVR